MPAGGGCDSRSSRISVRSVRDSRIGAGKFSVRSCVIRVTSRRSVVIVMAPRSARSRETDSASRCATARTSAARVLRSAIRDQRSRNGGAPRRARAAGHLPRTRPDAIACPGAQPRVHVGTRQRARPGRACFRPQRPSVRMASASLLLPLGIAGQRRQRADRQVRQRRLLSFGSTTVMPGRCVRQQPRGHPRGREGHAHAQALLGRQRCTSRRDLGRRADHPAKPAGVEHDDAIAVRLRRAANTRARSRTRARHARQTRRHGQDNRSRLHPSLSHMKT